MKTDEVDIYHSTWSPGEKNFTTKVDFRWQVGGYDWQGQEAGLFEGGGI
jgi:hypothetical protein